MNSNTPAQTHPRQKTAVIAIEQEKSPPAAWREFTAGMEFLRRYGIHNTANSSAISRNNLRLLHRALLQDSEYRQLITTARRETPQLTRPSWSTLTASHQLHAHLISIPAKSSIQLTTHFGYLGMFLILSGSAETFIRTETPSRLWHSRWPRSWLPSNQTHANAHHLKADDVICVTHNTSNTSLLITGKKACIILAVFNATSTRQPHPTAVTDRSQA